MGGGLDCRLQVLEKLVILGHDGEIGNKGSIKKVNSRHRT